MRNPVASILNRITRIEYSVTLLILVPVVVGGIRALLESLLIGVRTDFVSNELPFLHYVVFYMLLQMCVATIFSVVTGQGYRKFIGVASVGLLAAWLPPILDIGFLLAGLRQSHRLYFFFREFNWDLRSERMLVGETLVLWLSLALVIIYLAWYTRSFLRTLIGGVLYYGLFHILGWLWFILAAWIVGAESLDTVKHMGWIGLGLVWFLYFIFNRKTMLPSLRRIGHAIPWGLLASIGARLCGYDWWTVVLLGAVFVAVVQMTIYLNDYFDRSMDGKLSGTARPVTRDDALFSSFILLLLALHVYWIFPERFYLVATFIAMSTAYHLPGVRLKRVLGVAYLMEGATAAMALLFGIGLEGLDDVGFRAIVVVAMAFGGFAVGSIIKDYKDIDQDRAAGVNTFYTLVSGEGCSLRSLHILGSSLLTVALMVPTAYLYFSGEPVGMVAVMGVLSLLPQICLLSIKNRRIAVQAGIWSVNAYLAALVFILPGEFIRLFQ